MSLSQLWSKTPEQLEGKQLHQIIAFAGDGRLRDDGDTSREFRAFLAEVPSRVLKGFVDECLNAGFSDSGFALQDVVNEVGRRLGFEVVNGRYQGRKGAVGFDGLWTLPTRHTLVVEVKTTDAYRIDTGKLAGYRKELASQSTLSEEASSVLLVVGRDDTGELEAQIRGSRHAWDIRLISADALLRLMFLKEALDDPSTIARISGILIPREYTRLDEIVELVFFATEEAKIEDADVAADDEVDDAAESHESRSGPTPVAFHEACIKRLGAAREWTLVKRSKSRWETPDGSVRIVCVVSKTHGAVDRPKYWFAYHPHQQEYLSAGANSLLVLGCGNAEQVLAIPADIVKTCLDDLWTTELTEAGRFYWHIRLARHDGRIWLDRRKGKGQLDVTEFLIAQ